MKPRSAFVSFIFVAIATISLPRGGANLILVTHDEAFYKDSRLDTFCFCPPIYNRICGEDGETYNSLCEAKCANTRPNCAGDCPCQEEEVPDGCTEYCTPLFGPSPLPELPEECEGGADGEIQDEDAFIQDACDRIRKMGLFRYCYEVCVFEHRPIISASHVFGK